MCRAAVREGVLGKMVASEVENDQAKLQEDIVKGSSGRCRLWATPSAGRSGPAQGDFVMTRFWALSAPRC